MILLVLLLLSSVVIAQEEDDFYEETEAWHDTLHLDWIDFRGVPDDESEASAQSWVGVNYYWRCLDGDFYFETEAIFFRDSSWVKPDRKVDRLLQHEQGHFDIAEVHTRQLRRAVAAENGWCDDIEETRQRIEALVVVNRKALQAMQRTYDSETKHGRKKKKQKEWLEKIVDALDSLSEHRKLP